MVGVPWPQNNTKNFKLKNMNVKLHNDYFHTVKLGSTFKILRFQHVRSDYIYFFQHKLHLFKKKNFVIKMNTSRN